MSKSRGNVINPREVLDNFGAEPFRLWAAVEGNLTKTDFRCSFDRIDGAGKTLTKLWNITRFISMFPEKKSTKLTNLDKWIINEMNELISFSKNQYEQYNFHDPAINIKHFIWETFASHYMELVKNRAYNSIKYFTKQEQDSACYTLHYCLDNLLKLLAPITPMITYKIYKNLRKKDIHFERFPAESKKYKTLFSTKDIELLNSEIWKAKKDRGISLKEEIKSLTVPNKLKSIKKDLVMTHNAKELKFGNELSISF